LLTQNEAYAGIATSVFWPIILKALASQAAFEQDHVTPCNVTRGIGEKYFCDVSLFGWWIDTSSIVLYAQSLSVFLQFIVFVSLGSLADHGSRRKSYMINFTYLTAFIGVLILAVVSPSLWWLAYFIYILANVAYGASHVFNYAWVPTLTHYQENVIKARQDPDVGDEEYYKIQDQEANIISSNGFYYGYFSSFGQMLVFITVAIFLKAEWLGLTSTYPLQICIAAICFIMFFVTYRYTARLMKTRPGPPIPEGMNYITFSILNRIFLFTKCGIP
jgi:UMF1 family MFS transporter